MNYKIIKATKENINQVGELFDLYRQFYKYKSNVHESKKYINERLQNKESIIYIALSEKKEALGFVQLYETFGSLQMGKIVILYDLYVKREFRKLGIANQLMKKSEEFAKSIGAKSIELSTAKNNFNAQSLYEKIGYTKDEEFLTYSYDLK